MTGKTTKINFPKAGMGIEEGTVGRWLKAVGENVREGEVIIEIETAKAVQDVLAPISGTLIEILINQGETVPVNTILGLIQALDG
jgi:pyruvate/2-oxoglutarate dehydrogenase complex dihydrolipoamide acyltransferase (E2) component